jgi:hypothetical protein
MLCSPVQNGSDALRSGWLTAVVAMVIDRVVTIAKGGWAAGIQCTRTRHQPTAELAVDWYRNLWD